MFSDEFVLPPIKKSTRPPVVGACKSVFYLPTFVQIENFHHRRKFQAATTLYDFLFLQ